jgi:DNA-binding transcriptional MerR regulator
MTPAEAAEYVGTSEGTLRWYRCRGGGPPYHKEGARYFYLRDELDAYRAEKERAAPRTQGERP